ncbi:MAG TPA: HAMP domain-containing protein, partial [Longimicrobiales bacterium]|nr:HAMP domain-containing protein [Longimicrobiales bacterium]
MTTEGGRSPREGVLRRRLLGAFLLLSLVPLFGSNAIGYLRSRGIVEGLVTRYLEGMAGLEAAHVQGTVEQRLLYLAAIGNGNRFLEAAAQGHGPGAVEGMAAVADRAAARAYLRRKLEESGRFGALALFTRSGTLVASTDRGEAVAGWSPEGTAPVALLRAATPTSSPTLRLTVAVTDQPGVPEAWLVATIPLNEAGEFLEIPEHVAGTIESFITDAQGRPIFVSHVHGHLRYDQPLASPLLEMAPGAHARYLNPEGVEVIGALAALPAYGWRFLMEVPAADALGELGALRNLSLMLGSLFAVLVLAAGWFLAGGIVAPVRRLVTAARALGAGDLEVRVPDPGRDEIGELSEAFNEMAGELAANQKRLAQLHRREIERAQQLATVGELASGVAHEIKNPVVGISNGLDLVLRRVDDPGLEPITSEM